MRLKNSEIQKSKGCFTVLSETYQDFANNTSIHGLKYTVSTKVGPYEKVFWSLITIFGLYGAVYMTMLFWERYTSNLTRTTVFTAYAPTTEIQFPGVTICNLNSIMTPKVQEFMKKLEYNDTDESIIRNALSQLLSYTRSGFQPNMTEINILQNVLEQNGYLDTTVVMEEISQSCKDMLIQCVWNTKEISCLEYFYKTFSQLGICCSFNYNNGKKISQLYSQYSGLDTGLRVLLNSQTQQACYSRIYSSGFKVIIHHPSDYPGLQTDSRIATVGKLTYLQIVGTKLTCSNGVKNLPIIHRQCLYPDEYRLKYFGNNYNEDNCHLECEENLYYKLCECVPFYFSFSDKPTCNISKIPCLQRAKSDRQLFDEMEDCFCTAQCEDISYQILSTSARMQYGRSFSMMSFGNISVHDGYNVLNIFFLNNRQTILVRDTITSTLYLLSSFGGVYSLFMGCSLITIAEIIYYGIFRFLVNLKLFGRVNVDVKDNTEPKKRPKRVSFVQEYGNVSHIYGNTSYYGS
ncbi:sodium channel protein Nach-like [Anoplophora glabripennis]|uniref:sodium channel protein Nach-like n=1 Tax=Anoplophora glabripennis TaxID=217634 RepID=UPI000875241D|nr:sodium channel protein Nach-like [Anoplophora glabripennis]